MIDREWLAKACGLKGESFKHFVLSLRTPWLPVAPQLLLAPPATPHPRDALPLERKATRGVVGGASEERAS